jgi:hypothetical protein
VRVERDQILSGDAEVREQAARPSRVLGGDDGDLAQRSNGACREIVEVSDRCADHEERHVGAG